jgi:hypothetical protein
MTSIEDLVFRGQIPLTILDVISGPGIGVKMGVKGKDGKTAARGPQRVLGQTFKSRSIVRDSWSDGTGTLLRVVNLPPLFPK